MLAPSAPRLIEQIAAEFAARLRARFGADLIAVRLFGSHARGQANEDSDVDVFVLLREADWAARRAVLNLAGDLWVARDVLLSPTVFALDTYRLWRTQERPLVMDIERQGIAL